MSPHNPPPTTPHTHLCGVDGSLHNGEVISVQNVVEIRDLPSNDRRRTDHHWSASLHNTLISTSNTLASRNTYFNRASYSFLPNFSLTAWAVSLLKAKEIHHHCSCCLVWSTNSNRKSLFRVKELKQGRSKVPKLHFCWNTPTLAKYTFFFKSMLDNDESFSTAS